MQGNKSRGHKKFSGHGSMTKAGKVRDRTPRVRKTGVNSKPKKIPRLRYKDSYNKRFIKKGFGGQPDSIGAKKHKQAQRQKRKEEKDRLRSKRV